MNIAFFMDRHDPLGGVSLWSLRIAKSLVEFGIDARAIGLDDGSSTEPYAENLLKGYEWQKVTVTGAVTPGYPQNQLRSWSEVSNEARECVAWADVIVPNYFEFGFRLAALAAMEGKAVGVLAFVHTDEEHYYNLLSRYSPIVSHFVAVSRRCRDTMSSRISAAGASRPVDYLPYGVVPSPVRRQERSAGPLRMAYVGRLEQYQKRVFDLGGIVQRLLHGGDGFELKIVGAGSGESELRRLLADAPGGAVQFLGVRTAEQIAAVYSWADILLLTSDMEGLPFVLLEAMSFGCIPVVTRVSGNEDLVEHGRNGFLFDVGDVTGVAKLLQSLIRRPAAITPLAQRAQHLISTHFTWQQHVSAVSQAALSALSKDPPFVAESIALLSRECHKPAEACNRK